ncbi:MAG: hypothetical protein ACTSUF_09735 [Candidatus Heimdallarchaeaceae archaeon]
MEKGPIRSEWIPLGEEFAVRFVLWDRNLTIEKKKKVNNDWQTSQMIRLSRRLLTELLPRIPVYLDLMFKYGEKPVEEKKENWQEVSEWKKVE